MPNAISMLVPSNQPAEFALMSPFVFRLILLFLARRGPTLTTTMNTSASMAGGNLTGGPVEFTPA